MTIEEFATLAKTIGLPGAAIAFITWLAARNGLGPRDDPSRADVMAKLDKLDDKFDTMRDRLTALEASSKEIQRRVDRLDR